MKTTVKVLSLQANPQGGYVLVCRPTKENPTGNYKVNEGLVRRMAERTLGISSIPALKQVIALSNGGAEYSITFQACKQGETWENKKTGETGIYEKDWNKPVNHEITLSPSAQLEVTRIIFANELSNSAMHQPQVVATVSSTKDDSASTQESNDAPSI